MIVFKKVAAILHHFFRLFTHLDNTAKTNQFSLSWIKSDHLKLQLRSSGVLRKHRHALWQPQPLNRGSRHASARVAMLVRVAFMSNSRICRFRVAELRYVPFTWGKKSLKVSMRQLPCSSEHASFSTKTPLLLHVNCSASKKQTKKKTNRFCFNDCIKSVKISLHLCMLYND